MRTNKLYANASNRIFDPKEIPFFDALLGSETSKRIPLSIVEWPIPLSQKGLRKWIGLTDYLHKYIKNYTDMVGPLSNLLKGMRNNVGMQNA